MPKVKHGRRRNHYRAKNSERRFARKVLQDITSVADGNAQLPMETASIHTEVPTNDFFSQLQSLSMEKWHVYCNSDCVELSFLDNSPPQASVVKFTLTIYNNLHWVVRLYGKLLTATEFVDAHPITITSLPQLQSLCNSLTTMTICSGNSDDAFLKLLEDRGGVVMNGTSVIAYLDKSPHSTTVRHINCPLICANGEQSCASCHQYRPTLRAMRSRSQKAASMSTSRTASGSHTNYRYLSSDELKERLSNVQNEKRLAEKKLKRLKEKLCVKIDEEGVELNQEDCDDLSEIFEEADKATKTLTREHFQKIFWEQQRQYNQLKNKRGVRWHPLMIRFALNLRYLSSSAYRALSNFIALPSQRTLCDYTHIMDVAAGVSYSMIGKMKADMKFDDSTAADRIVGILFDEMKVKSGLVFNKQSGRLVGFVDLGSLNSELAALEKVLSRDNGITSEPPELAQSMLVLMARRVIKPSCTFPVAQFPTSSLSGEKLYPIVWDTIEAMEMNQFQVLYVTCDGLSANRKFFKLSQNVGDPLSFPYKTMNPFNPDRELFFFCDAPHLLKTVRNCFSNSFAHSHSRMLKKAGKYISWKHIEEVYEKDQMSKCLGLSLCHKLTPQHIVLTPYAKMKVCLAAQVLSSTVADALTFYDEEETTETRIFIRHMDNFFDCLNVRCHEEGIKKRKQWREAYFHSWDERFKWLKDTFLKYLDEWEAEIDGDSKIGKRMKPRMLLSRETREGLHITILSFCELGPKLLKQDGVHYLLSEVFSQDPLEAYFSRQRHRGGSCDNPTVQQFHYNTVSLAQQGAIYKDLKSMNVMGSTTTLREDCDAPLEKRHKAAKQ